MDQKIGGRAVSGFVNHSIFFEMAIEQLNPYHSVQWICSCGNKKEWIGTAQIFSISQSSVNGVVNVKFSHTGWKSDTGYIFLCNTTWGHLMFNLKLFIEESIKKVLKKATKGGKHDSL